MSKLYYRQSWNRVTNASQEVRLISSRSDPLPRDSSRSLLPFGNGRSYGDCCLNDDGIILPTRSLQKILSFDPAKGVICCESGVTLDKLLEVIVPHGWFLPVTPGTRFVTIGGAIANDVHGKNHFISGTFGCHIVKFELLRSDGIHRICSPMENRELFYASIAGLGLTGLITWAELKLMPISGPLFESERIPFHGIEEFTDLARESLPGFEYCVAWVDFANDAKLFGRGILTRGRHASGLESGASHPLAGSRRLGGFNIPDFMPAVPFPRTAQKLFNFFYFVSETAKQGIVLSHYNSFLYPLDALPGWNKLVGRNGFFQYQCSFPSPRAVAALLDRLRASSERPFLSVLKLFGPIHSPGLLSFPSQGITLSLDFENHGSSTRALLEDFDSLIIASGGRIYPGKDARMSGLTFRTIFKNWSQFAFFIDPEFSSSFWRRVTR